MKTNLNLFFYNSHNNFGDQLSPFILDMMVNKDKFSIHYNKDINGISILMIGSYLQKAINDSYIYGTGVRTDPPMEPFNQYARLNVCAVRGPITKSFLEKKGFKVPEIFGDPALLLPLFYNSILEGIVLVCITSFISNNLVKKRQ